MDFSKDKIEATLKKAESMGTGNGGQTVSYEALGPTSSDGVPIALIVECSTDSPPRTHARVKEAFNKNDISRSRSDFRWASKVLAPVGRYDESKESF